MSLAFSGRRMQLRVRIIRTDRISSFIDTTRATALPATRLNRSICGLGAIASRWWRPRAKSAAALASDRPNPGPDRLAHGPPPLWKNREFCSLIDPAHIKSDEGSARIHPRER